MNGIKTVQIPQFSTVQRLLAPGERFGERVMSETAERLTADETAALQQIFSLDDMGRAEFEMGGLARTVRALRDAADTR